MQPVRVGVVGLGNFGRLHARTLAGLAEAELVALVDRRPERLAELDLPGARRWTDLGAALRESDVEAWVVATQTNTHVALAGQILATGASVLIEKPLAADLASARRLAPLIAADSRNLMLGHILLFAPEFRRLLEQVRRRSAPVYIQAVRHRPAGTAALFPGETPLRLLMIHDLYLALVLIGADPSRATARLHRQAGYCDLALAELEWPGDVWGSFTASFLTPPGMPGDGFDRLEVFGADWAARLELNPRPLTVWAERAEWPLALDIHDDPAAPSGWLAEELRHFCRVVRGRATVPFGARYEDGVRLMAWLERLEQSAA
ncbi:MAG TPA: Gfo/Idh/MocA family oxidoreductase [Roseiflexaceae bacterium]|nr:Gfo/Idh/MocA family oxidoreductase [Roseiflexaceae bacterium]